MSQVQIVVPCYNEESRLDRPAFESFLRGSTGPGLLFVDDGSKDGTRDRLDGLAAVNPERARVLALDSNGGKAEAVRRGLRRALDDGARHVGFWDADLATPLADISEFVAILEDAPDIDVVMGARVRMLGRHVERFGTRHLVGRAYATLASTVLALPVYDTQCGAKVFRGSGALERALESPFTSRWGFDVELLRRLQDGWGDRGIDRIIEVPLRDWRDPGNSKVSLGQGAAAFLALIGMLANGAWRLPVDREHAIEEAGGNDGRAALGEAPTLRE